MPDLLDLSSGTLWFIPSEKMDHGGRMKLHVITVDVQRCSTMFKVCIQHSFNLYSSLEDVLPFSSFFPQYEVAICFTTVLQATLLRLLEATAATAAGCAVSWAAQPLLRLPSSWPPALRDVRDRESEGE